MCFTLNNYTEEEYQDILDKLNYIIVGKEVGAAGTPHLQGYLMERHSCLMWLFYVMMVLYYMKMVLYYMKIVLLYIKIVLYYMKMVLYYMKVVLYYMKSVLKKKKIIELANEIEDERQETKRKESFMKKELRPWQIEAVKKLEEQDDRKILFVVDREGNTGKTLEAIKQARVLSNMKSADAKYLMESEDQFVVFDLVRSSLDYVNYGVMEEIKNGCFTSTKNECRRKVYERVMKVVVFMNQYPDETKLSKDTCRWDIMDLDKEKVEGLRQHASSSQGERPGTHRSVVSQASEDSVEKIINQIDNLLASYN